MRLHVKLAVFFSLIATSQASADLVFNGGFETGDFSGWTLTGDPSVNFVLGGFNHSGNYAAWFGETGDLGSLSQVLATTAGTSYTLNFWFAGFGDDPSEFTASVEGNTLLDLVNPPFDFDYVPYSFTFTATSTATLLNFGFRDDANFINLDDVSVDVTSSSTPEPRSIVLVGFGLIATLLFSRRFRLPFQAS